MQIETERLVLRDPSSDDVDALLAYESDPRYLEHYPWRVRAREDVEAMVATFVGWAGEEPRSSYQLIVADRSDGRVIGCCGVRREHARAPGGDVGYELDPESWGRGYAREAVVSLLEFAFRELSMRWVSACTVASNERSIRLLERLGFQRTYTLPPSQEDGVSWPKRALYTLDRRDWRADPGADPGS